LKAFFLISFVGLLALSAFAWSIYPKHDVQDGKIQLTWTSDDNPLRRAQLAPFNELNPDCHLELDPNNAEMQKVIVQSLAGVGPDLFDCYSGYALSAFVKAGIAWDITDELKKRGIEIEKECWPAVVPCAMYEGRAYGFPVNAAVNGLWYHKDLAEAAGVSIPSGPWTWQQAVPMLQKLTVRNADGGIERYGIVLDWDNNYRQFVQQWGGRMYTPDGTRCIIDSPQAIEAIQFMQDLVTRYHVSPTVAEEKSLSAAGGWGGGSVITLFGAKKAATALGGRWWLCRLRDPDYAQLRLAAAESPYGQVRTFVGYGKATLINKNSPHREAALKFMDYLHGERYNRLINHQADGIGPVMKYAQGDAFLHDPAYPQEDYNGVWREMQKAATAEQVSPFMNGSVLQRVMLQQLDQVKSGDKTPRAAMEAAAREVNDIIADNVKRVPALRAQYEKLRENSQKQMMDAG
jgi:multiple sugar transport system substrate-binding protein